MKHYLKNAIFEQKLPESFSTIIEEHYMPIARQVAERAQADEATYVLGVQGSQGSGKSTLASFAQQILENEFGLRVVSLSLDDFYLTLEERTDLSRKVHPLLKTRGVPGTHDVQLATETIESLKALQAGERLPITRFDKSIDDRAAHEDWDDAEGPIDVIIFEGWCVGVGPQTAEELSQPINQLESVEDESCVWREFVNEQLDGEYRELFAGLDSLLVLQAPSFEVVFEWRSLQEAKLADKAAANSQRADKLRIQSSDELRRFISHYERLTRQCIESLPQKADWVLYLDNQHRIDTKR